MYNFSIQHDSIRALNGSMMRVVFIALVLRSKFVEEVEDTKSERC